MSKLWMVMWLACAGLTCSLPAEAGEAAQLVLDTGDIGSFSQMASADDASREQVGESIKLGDDARESSVQRDLYREVEDRHQDRHHEREFEDRGHDEHEHESPSLPVPEANSLVLLALGLSVMFFARRRLAVQR